MGLGGITVRLSGMADAEMTTDNSGGYKFDALRGGTYSVEISGFEAGEVSFSSTSGAATVGVGETKVVSFDGTYVRTAGVQGQVSVDGEGLEGVTVTLKGDGEDRSEITNAAGQYAFSMLKSGTYQVGIINPDPDDYEFETTSKTATIATGETANVPFEGTLLRTAGIAGRVSVEGMGLDGVTVTLAFGSEQSTAETANGGQYSFAGLAAGTYVLTITNPDPVAYDFAEEDMTENVVLADDQSAIVNFEGTHTRTAQISGMLYIDEAPQDTMYNDGEPSIVEALAPLLPTLSEEARAMVMGLLATAKVSLRGPDLNTVVPVDINADGSFSTGESLMAGTYQLELPVNDEAVAGALKAAGVAFVGGSMVRTVAAGGSETANFPFRITMQTVNVEAVMARAAEEEIPADRARVEKVKLKVYANADGTGMLGEGETDAMGMASFTFARDANTGPAGNDNIVFVKAESPSDALAITDNAFVEVAYDGTERVSNAGAAVRFVNVAVNFDFWVKSNEMARNGNMGLGGWRVQYCMPMAKTDDAEAVVCEGVKAAFKDIMVGEGDDAEPVVTDTTTAMDNENLGKASFATTVDKTMLPAKFHVRVTPVAVDEDGKRTNVQSKVDGGEMWEATTLDAYEHTGLDLPPGKDDDPIDLGPIRITWTTQALVVGAHRELDDQPGYSQYRSDYPHDDADTDARPSDGLLEVELMYSENGGRLKRYEYKKFDAKGERKTEVDNPMAVTGGMATFPNLPTDMDFTVRIRPGSDRVAVTERDVDAYGLDDAATRIVGTFGAGAGAMPDIWVCPETDVTPMDDDFKARCSAFGYQWNTGTQKVTVGNLRKDVVATVALEPVTDNFSEGDSKDLKGTQTASGSNPDKSHTFTGIQDGVYRVTVAGSGIGKQDPERRVFYHDEGSDDEEYDGEVGDDASFEATSLRAEIRGLVANDRTGNGNLTGDEAFGGVELTLHKTAKNADDETVIGAAVKDDDGNAVTARTNADGEYAFENLEEDGEYFVKVTECDGCVAYRSIDGETHEFISHAMGTARVYSATATNTPPKWDHEATAIGDIISGVTGSFVDFVGLYTDGEVSGAVKEAFDNVGRHRVELERCLTYKAAVEDDATTTEVDESAPATCGLRDETFAMDRRTDDDGDWSFEGLREGIYEAEVNPRGSYTIRDGSDAAQLLMLTDGSGASDEADDVSIVDSGKGTETRLRGLTMALASSPGSSLIGAATGVAPDVDLDGDGTSDVIDPATSISSPGTQAFATNLVLRATAYDKNASIAVAVVAQAADGTDPTAAKDFSSIESGKNAGVKRVSGTNVVTIKVTAANGVASSTYSFTFARTAAQTGFVVSDIVVGCADDTNAACTVTYGAGFTTDDDGSVDQVSNVGGELTVTIPANAHRVSVGGTIGEFSAAVTRATTSDLAAVSFKVGDAGATTGDASAAVVTENFVIPAQGGTRTIKITVMSEAEKYGVRDEDDPKEEKVWTLTVKRAEPS